MASSDGIELLETLADALAPDGPVEIGTMFRSPGLRTNGAIVAFLGGDRLIVKVPQDRAAELVDDGLAEPVTMGTRTMREWVAVPMAASPGETADRWTPLAREALTYVRSVQ